MARCSTYSVPSPVRSTWCASTQQRNLRRSILGRAHRCSMLRSTPTSRFTCSSPKYGRCAAPMPLGKTTTSLHRSTWTSRTTSRNARCRSDAVVSTLRPPVPPQVTATPTPTKPALAELPQQAAMPGADLGHQPMAMLSSPIHGTVPLPVVPVPVPVAVPAIILPGIRCPTALRWVGSQCFRQEANHRGFLVSQCGRATGLPHRLRPPGSGGLLLGMVDHRNSNINSCSATSGARLPLCLRPALGRGRSRGPGLLP